MTPTKRANKATLSRIRLPKVVYAGVHVEKNGLHIACTNNGKRPAACAYVPIGTSLVATALSWLREYEKAQNANVVAAGISGDGPIERLFAKLWLALDTVPLSVQPTDTDPKKIVTKSAKYAASLFDEFGALPAAVTDDNRVKIRPLVRLENYEAITPPAEFRQYLQLASEFGKKRLTFISATPQGGGVALMRHALMRLFALSGVKASWHVLEEDPNIFDITKTKFHNVLQNVNADPSICLDDRDKLRFADWSARNAKILSRRIAQSDVVVIDDPQPSGLIPHIKKRNPSARIIYRSHIQLEAALADNPETAQYITWEFIKQNIAGYDLFVSHPMKQFVPKHIPKEKLVYMGATTDPLDGLNKELPNEQEDYYRLMINKFLTDAGQTPLDHTRPYLVQVARFDPSKGIPDVIDAFARLCGKIDHRRQPLPQLVITGNSSIDDPDGIPIYNLAMNLLRSVKYRHLQKEVKVIRLPHYDQLLDAVLRQSTIALQLSHKEGFEVKVSEALMKGVPMVAYKTGGIPLQIEHGQNGFLVEPGDTEMVATHLHELLTDKALYMRMSDYAIRNVSRDVLTVKNAIAWLWMANELANGRTVRANGRYIHDLVNAKK